MGHLLGVEKEKMPFHVERISIHPVSRIMHGNRGRTGYAAWTGRRVLHRIVDAASLDKKAPR